MRQKNNNLTFTMKPKEFSKPEMVKSLGKKPSQKKKLGLTQKYHTEVKDKNHNNFYNTKSTEGLSHPYSRQDYTSKTQSLQKQIDKINDDDLEIDPQSMVGEPLSTAAGQSIIM